MAKELFNRARDVGIDVVLDESSKNFLVEKGYDAKFGARPLRRAIQKYIEDPLAEAILANNLANGDKIKITHDGKEETNELSIEMIKTPAEKPTKSKRSTKSAKSDDAKSGSDDKPKSSKTPEKSAE